MRTGALLGATGQHLRRGGERQRAASLNSVMLLSEILEPARVLTATARFRDSFNSFKKSYPIIDSTLRAFIDFRMTHRPDESYASKDAPFSVHNELRGFRHFHMVHGRVILVYQITSSELRLCLVTDHSYSTTIGTNRLINALHSPNTSYEPITVQQQFKLSSSQINDIHQLFYEFAADDRDGLIHATTHLDELLEFVRLVIDVPWTDAQKDQATFGAFGGEQGLVKAVQKILQQNAVRV
jgi:mRNA-degrading endonuclease YafQ of YafQ-DinJ toxin-antitoxin module